jgi:predicted RNA-binding protein
MGFPRPLPQLGERGRVRGLPHVNTIMRPLIRRYGDMCEASAFLFKNGKEELVLESVDEVTPEGDREFRLVNIFGEQKIIQAKLKSMNLVNHKILFEE